MSAGDRKQVVISTVVIFGLFALAGVAMFLIDLRFGS